MSQCMCVVVAGVKYVTVYVCCCSWCEAVCHSVCVYVVAGVKQYVTVYVCML